MDLERFKEQERRRLDAFMRDRGATPDERRASLRKLRDQQAEYAQQRYNALFTGSPDFWIKAERIERYERQQLLGGLWSEGEIAVLAGRSGIGKSIFAVQLANALAGGEAFGPYPPAEPRSVLYVDLDTSPELFARRYSRNVDGRLVGYEFAEGFMRSVFEWDSPLPPGYDSMEHLIYDSIFDTLAEYECGTVIIDSLPQIAAHAAGRNVTDFIMRLKTLRDLSKVSILLVAETTPAGRTPDAVSHDLAGPGIVRSVADSIFTLSPRRRSPHVRYLKHVKSSASTAASGTSVELFEIRGRGDAPGTVTVAGPGEPMPADGFPEFHHIGRSSEELRSIRGAITDPEMGRHVRQLAAGGLTTGSIALALEISPVAVRSYLLPTPPRKPVNFIDITPDPPRHPEPE